MNFNIFENSIIVLVINLYLFTILVFKPDQNSTDVSVFKFYDGEFAERADYVAMTLDATGTGGKSFVKLFSNNNNRFNVTIYIPGRPGVSVKYIFNI